jgi:hypothetical protein
VRHPALRLCPRQQKYSSAWWSDSEVRHCSAHVPVRASESAFPRFESYRGITQPSPERPNKTAVARMSRRCAPQARLDGEMRGIPGSRGAPTIASGRMRAERRSSGLRASPSAHRDTLSGRGRWIKLESDWFHGIGPLRLSPCTVTASANREHGWMRCPIAVHNENGRSPFSIVANQADNSIPRTRGPNQPKDQVDIQSPGLYV